MNHIHDLKIWPVYFKLQSEGKKHFEIRRNDRDFKEKDLLLLREFDPEIQQYTGRSLRRLITCVIPINNFGCDTDLVVMGTEESSVMSGLIPMKAPVAQ